MNKKLSQEQKIRNLYAEDPNADFSKLITNSHKFSEKFMKEFPIEPGWRFNYNYGEVSPWERFVKTQVLSESFIAKNIRMFKNGGIFEDILRHKKLSEKFIERHAESFQEWWTVAERQKLSERFIENHSIYLTWERICSFQNLSEAFIEKHKKEVDWKAISYKQNLSIDFINRHSDKLDFAALFKSRKFPKSFYQKHFDKLIEVVRGK